MTSWSCPRCKKRFISEKLAEIHLEWMHNVIPIYTPEDVIKRSKEELRKLKDKDDLDQFFWE